ncbi:MAG: hypothetical protein ACPGLV_17725, partial [Bacteroidia bacterium]
SFLAVTSQPSGVSSGVAFAVQVSVYDQYHNLVRVLFRCVVVKISHLSLYFQERAKITKI